MAQAGARKVWGDAKFSSRRAEKKTVRQVLQVVEVGGARAGQQKSTQGGGKCQRWETGARNRDNLSAPRGAMNSFRSECDGEIQTVQVGGTSEVCSQWESDGWSRRS